MSPDTHQALPQHPAVPAAEPDGETVAAEPTPETVAAEPTPERPPLIGLVSYVFGTPMPARYRDWVARDLLSKGWRHRQAIRLLLTSVPFAVIFLVLPGQLNVRLTIAVFLLVTGLGLGYATSGSFRARRLEQHGLGPPPEQERL